jgi:hypothetical protein
MEDSREAQLAEKKLASTNQAQTTRQASFPALRVIIVEVYGADDAHSIVACRPLRGFIGR